MTIVIRVESGFNFPQNACAHILSYTQGRNTNGGSDTPVYTSPGTPICRYWKAGNCTKAEGCQFRHDPEVSQVSHSVQNQKSAEEPDEATRGDNWHLREARRQKENDAGNDINVERRQQYTK